MWVIVSLFLRFSCALADLRHHPVNLERVVIFFLERAVCVPQALTDL